ncbi:MAG: S8 family serine peptidase, partial [Thermocrispum sp.]
MLRRTRVAGAGVAALALAAGGLLATTSPVAAQNEEPAAHFVVVGPQKGSMSKTLQSIKAAGGTVVKTWTQVGVVIVKSTDAEFAQSVRNRPGVQQAGASRALAELLPTGTRTLSAAEADRIEAPTQRSDGKREPSAKVDQEPLAPNQWDMRLIDADAANQVSGGDRSIVVGVLDSGIDATHPDLAPNIDVGNSVGCTNEGVPDTSPAAWAPTTSDHGTHVAGTIAAARNGVGIAGVAPNVRLASIKVVSDE